jgi:hypothetical protein
MDQCSAALPDERASYSGNERATPASHGDQRATSATAQIAD